MLKKPSFIITAGVIAFVIISLITFNNSIVTLQEQIEAKHTDNKQVYSSIRIKIEQAGLVANTYSDQVVRAIETAIGSRYGDGGAKGAMLWIKEQNPEIDPATYTKLQQIIESEFTRFESNQTTLLDLGRVYKTKIRKFPGSFLASILGYSKEDMDKYLTVLTTKEAQEDFDTGNMTAPNTFGTK
jgi:hypothetical protein